MIHVGSSKIITLTIKLLICSASPVWPYVVRKSCYMEVVNVTQTYEFWAVGTGYSCFLPRTNGGEESCQVQINAFSTNNITWFPGYCVIGRELRTCVPARFFKVHAARGLLADLGEDHDSIQFVAEDSYHVMIRDMKACSVWQWKLGWAQDDAEQNAPIIPTSLFRRSSLRSWLTQKYVMPCQIFLKPKVNFKKRVIDRSGQKKAQAISWLNTWLRFSICLWQDVLEA